MSLNWFNFLEMLLNGLLNLTDLVPITPLAPEQDALWNGHDTAPAGDDLAEADNDAFHLTYINELAINAVLQLLNGLAEEQRSLLIVKEELAKSLSNTQMLLLLTLVRHLFHRVFVALLRIQFQLLLSCDHVEGLLRDAMLRQSIKVRLTILAKRALL